MQKISGKCRTRCSTGIPFDPARGLSKKKGAHNMKQQLSWKNGTILEEWMCDRNVSTSVVQ